MDSPRPLSQGSSLLAQIIEIGALQFGQFETQPGNFAPFTLFLELIPSYPKVLRHLSELLTPLVQFDGISHLLPMPACVPLGTAVSLATELPLVYPSGTVPQHIEGAYDYHVPTLLLTDIFIDGAAEGSLIQQARRDGLHVESLVAVFALGRGENLLTGQGQIPFKALFTQEDVLRAAPSPLMRQAVIEWLRVLT